MTAIVVMVKSVKSARKKNKHVDEARASVARLLTATSAVTCKAGSDALTALPAPSLWLFSSSVAADRLFFAQSFAVCSLSRPSLRRS